MLAEDELRDATLLVFANKQDLPNAMNCSELSNKLGLPNVRHRNWSVKPLCMREVRVVGQGPSVVGSIVYIVHLCALVGWRQAPKAHHPHRPWSAPGCHLLVLHRYIQGSCANTGEGLYEGMRWWHTL